MSTFYRLTELQGAVGLAQCDKVGQVVEQRHRLGSLLTELLGGIQGVAPPPVTPGGTHTYWSFPLRVTRWSPRHFAQALTAEGVPSSGGYIGKPIFLCAEALAAQRTFGSSGFPFTSPYTDRRVSYDDQLCPRAQDSLDHMVTLGINERFEEGDIRDIAGAIRKVAENLRSDLPE